MTTTKPRQMYVELDWDCFDLLLLALGMATGAALARKDRDLAERLLALANRINRNNPDWTPYAVQAGGHDDRETATALGMTAAATESTLPPQQRGQETQQRGPTPPDRFYFTGGKHG